MTPSAAVRQHLGWKLMLSYFVVVSVAVAVLIGTAAVHTPTALGRHAALMEEIAGGDSKMIGDLQQQFRAAVNEIVVVAAGAAAMVAVLVGIYTSRRIIEPISAMTRASRRIAGGDYHLRVPSAGDDELGQLARSFNQMAEALEKTETRRLALIGDVTHELRTPLSTIRGTMEGLIDGVILPDPAAYQQVQREVGRLQRLVQDLTELSRAEAGEIELRLAPVSPRQLIEQAAGRLRLQFEDKGVALEVQAGPAFPTLLVDQERMLQVLLNLLGNALHYTPPGGRVEIRADRTPVGLRITVRDDGIGIAAEDLPHLFERFYRVDKSRSRAGGGSGIGLTIARHLSEAHGGSIRAESAGPGQGSTFSVTLPAFEQAPPPAS